MKREFHNSHTSKLIQRGQDTLYRFCSSLRISDFCNKLYFSSVTDGLRRILHTKYPVTFVSVWIAAMWGVAMAASPDRVLLDSEWVFTQEGEAPRLVNLPHDWSVEGDFCQQAPANNDGGYLPTGKGTYEKTISIDDMSHHYRLLIEGAYMNSAVSVNGIEAGGHPYGYSSYIVDITPQLRLGENKITVSVDNSQQRNCRWYTGSGLYRHVWLLADADVHVPEWGIFITTPEVSEQKATVNVSVDVANDDAESNEATIRVDLLRSGQVIATKYTNTYLSASATTKVNFSFAIENPELWSPEAPNLYEARVTLTPLIGSPVFDVAEETFGIRKFEYSAQDGLRLNGKSIVLNGGCVHHDNGILGACSYDAAEAWKVKNMKQAGFNAVRTSHNPPAPAFLAECDRQGLIVIDEAFDGWKSAKTEHDYSELIDQWWETDIEALVLRDRNHPSVMAWSIGNEIIERKEAAAVERAHVMAEKCRALDPTRPVTQALAAWDDDWEIYDPLAAEHDIVGYNYMLHKAEGDHQRVPERVIWQTESYPRDAFRNWRAVDSLAYVIGDFVWTASDYIGESGIGRHYYEGEVLGEHWERQLWPWHGSQCGDIDLTGWRKPISHYRELLYNQSSATPIYMSVLEPYGYIGEIKETLWGNYPAYESWTWPGWEGKPIQVEVQSTYPRVAFYCNGRLIGEQPVGRDTEFKAVFTLPYEPGTIEARGVSDGDQSVSLSTAGEAADVRLSVSRLTGIADNVELAYVVAEIVDKDGNVVPTADVIEFEVEAPNELLACGSADPKDSVSYAKPYCHAKQGRALAIAKINANAPLRIRARRQPSSAR